MSPSFSGYELMLTAAFHGRHRELPGRWLREVRTSASPASSARAARAATSSSRARMTSTRTDEPAAATSQSGSARGVQRRVELDAEEAEPLADPLAHERRALADAGGEDERVEARRGGGHRCDGAGDAVHEDRERELGVGLAGERRALEVAHVARAAAEALQARLEVERVLELGRVEAVGASR